MGRYSADGIINQGSARASAKTVLRLRNAYKSGQITARVIVLGSGTRIDHLSYQYLGDPSYWWAIAALSNIGWALQLPAETRLIIPTNIDEIKAIE